MDVSPPPQVQLITCPACHGTSPANAMRCMWCGAPLTQSAPPAQMYQPMPVKTSWFARLKGWQKALLIVGILWLIGAASLVAQRGVGSFTSKPTPSTQTFTGTGPQATRAFRLEPGLARIHMVGTGGTSYKNFIVWLLDSSGEKLELLSNSIGPTDASQAVNISYTGMYVLQVETWTGKWTITVQQ